MKYTDGNVAKMPVEVARDIWVGLNQRVFAEEAYRRTTIFAASAGLVSPFLPPDEHALFALLTKRFTREADECA